MPFFEPVLSLFLFLLLAVPAFVSFYRLLLLSF